MIVRVVPYDSNWSRRFDLERGRLVGRLGDIVVALHHIGSTAVPGIWAKPIIDILLEVSDLAELDRCAPRMESLGYEVKGEFGIPGRRYFRRDDERGIRTHQVHAFASKSDDLARHLAFRDYMIANPQIAKSYGDLKQALAARFPNDIDAYSAGKDGFVKEHQAKALSWRAGRQAAQGLSGMPTVRKFAPEEWPTYRALRLRSLVDSPDAFGRTLAEEETRPDDEWAERLRSGCESGADLPLLAEVDSLPVGLAWGRFSNPANRQKANLFQMWVDPRFRRRGVGRTLLDAVINWAQDSAADYLILGVTCDTPAMRLYEKRGFVPAGERSPLREGSALLGQPMQLRLREGTE